MPNQRLLFHFFLNLRFKSNEGENIFQGLLRFSTFTPPSLLPLLLIAPPAEVPFPPAYPQAAHVLRVRVRIRIAALPAETGFVFFFEFRSTRKEKIFWVRKCYFFFLVIKLEIGRHVGFVSKCLKMAAALVHDGVWRLCLVHAKMAALSFVLFGMNLVNFFPQTMKRSGFRV